MKSKRNKNQVKDERPRTSRDEPKIIARYKGLKRPLTSSSGLDRSPRINAVRETVLSIARHDLDRQIKLNEEKKVSLYALKGNILRLSEKKEKIEREYYCYKKEAQNRQKQGSNFLIRRNGREQNIVIFNSKRNQLEEDIFSMRNKINKQRKNKVFLEVVFLRLQTDLQKSKLALEEIIQNTNQAKKSEKYVLSCINSERNKFNRRMDEFFAKWCRLRETQGSGRKRRQPPKKGVDKLKQELRKKILNFEEPNFAGSMDKQTEERIKQEIEIDVEFISNAAQSIEEIELRMDKFKASIHDLFLITGLNDLKAVVANFIDTGEANSVLVKNLSETKRELEQLKNKESFLRSELGRLTQRQSFIVPPEKAQEVNKEKLQTIEVTLEKLGKIEISLSNFREDTEKCNREEEEKLIWFTQCLSGIISDFIGIVETDFGNLVSKAEKRIGETNLEEEKIEREILFNLSSLRNKLVEFEQEDVVGEDGLGFDLVEPLESARLISDITTEVEKCLGYEEYLKDEVSISVLRMYDLIVETGEKYLLYPRLLKLIEENNVKVDNMEEVLMLLGQRGLLFNYASPEIQENVLVIDFDWLTTGLSKILENQFESANHLNNPLLNSHYRKFSTTGIITSDFFQIIWTSFGYDYVSQNFMLQIMLDCLLLSKYKFDQENMYFITSSPPQDIISAFSGTSQYAGLFFLIDFSGNYNDVKDEKISLLPLGIFEKFVCRLVESSSRFKNSMRPIVERTSAEISLGTKLHFCVYITKSASGEHIIKFRTSRGSRSAVVRRFIKEIYSVSQDIESHFKEVYPVGSTTFSCDVLVPSSIQTGQVLAKYNHIKSLFNGKVGWKHRFRPNPTMRETLRLQHYRIWLTALNKGPSKNFSSSSNRDRAVTLETMASRDQYRHLPHECRYHCFLSYRQEDSIDLVGRLYEQLENRGFRCWYDQELNNGGSLNWQAMEEGVKHSMVYILILSDNVFKSSYVQQEVIAATESKRKIFLLHHPDTGQKGKKDFAGYIAAAPDILKPVFSSIESIAIRRRYHEKVAFLNELEKRLYNLLQQALQT
eukprot:augustus_masked-scaffold_1-processed-gene-10.7-mRNA-1 protein AED:1.00 eAED:1.00 QI:0/0/0/0/1/1/2/0/1056